MTVINHEINDLYSFKTRIRSVELLIQYGKKYFKPLQYSGGKIDRAAAKKCYLLNKRRDDRIRRLHKIVEMFCEIPTYLATDVLFDTILKIMDILNKNSLNLEDILLINKNIEYYFNIYCEKYNICLEKEEG